MRAQVQNVRHCVTAERCRQATERKTDSFFPHDRGRGIDPAKVMIPHSNVTAGYGLVWNGTEINIPRSKLMRWGMFHSGVRAAKLPLGQVISLGATEERRNTKAQFWSCFHQELQKFVFASLFSHEIPQKKPLKPREIPQNHAKLIMVWLAFRNLDGKIKACAHTIAPLHRTLALYCRLGSNPMFVLF